MSALQVCQYRTDKGVYTAIVGEPGRKFLPVLLIDPPVRLRKVPLGERRYMRPIEYPVKRAARGFLKAGKTLGITKAARRFLNEAKRAGSTR